MKRTIILALSLVASCFSMNAQTWFPAKEGSKMTYANYDQRGKVSGYDVFDVKNITTNGGKTTIEYEITVLDAKKNPTGVVMPAKVWTADGYYHIDAKSSLTGIADVSQLDIKGHAPILPENPKNGEVLEDSHVSVESLMMTFDWTNIRVSTGQTVTTEAGTFNDAMLVEYDTLSKIAIVKVKASAKEWYVKGVGRVRSENYMKDKLTSVNELVSIEK